MSHRGRGPRRLLGGHAGVGPGPIGADLEPPWGGPRTRASAVAPGIDPRQPSLARGIDPRQADRYPGLALLDATAEGLDERGLRERARSLADASGAAAVSRSYSHPLALVAWHSDRVGVDIERVVPCDESFGRSICTPEEEADEPWRRDEDIISLWASKEALAKALGDALRYDPRRLDSPCGWTDGRSGPWRARRLRVGAEHRAWICWREPPTVAGPRARGPRA